MGVSAHRASAPAALIIPPIAITPDNVENNNPKNPKKEGVKGTLPYMLLPLLGERGGHPPSCRRELPNDFEKEGLNRSLIIFKMGHVPLY